MNIEETVPPDFSIDSCATAAGVDFVDATLGNDAALGVIAGPMAAILGSLQRRPTGSPIATVDNTPATRVDGV